MGYAITGFAFLLFVQARNVFPQLLLARLLFSIGSAAISTMITAILPLMISPRYHEGESNISTHSASNFHDPLPSPRLTVSPDRTRTGLEARKSYSSSTPTRLAGIVGFFTGCGALVALGLFLRLPELLQRAGVNPDQSLVRSYYIVGFLALVLSLVCLYGLRHLNGEEGKSWRNLVYGRPVDQTTRKRKVFSSLWSLIESISLGFRTPSLGLGYLGGFVARASSVGISLFIPLFVNAYFIETGLCNDAGHNSQEIKAKCRQAYVVAAELTGVSQLVALLFAPIFGYLAHRYRRYNLALSSAVGKSLPTSSDS